MKRALKVLLSVKSITGPASLVWQLKTNYNRMNPKLNAFTILEMAVTILLTLILFSMLYLSYNLIQRQLDEGNHDLSDMLGTKLCLDIQVANAEAITSGEQRVKFYNPLKTNYMLFENGYILLESADNQDTVYKGNYSYRLNVNPELGLIDRIDLEFMTGTDTLAVSSGKNYPPAIQLKRKEAGFDY